MIYIACPAYNATGGTELLHQLFYHLNIEGVDVRIIYTNIVWYKPFSITHSKFEKYGVKRAWRIIDNKSNLLITAETNVDILLKYSRIEKIVWWLSVNNYFNAKYKTKVNTIDFKLDDSEIKFFKSLKFNLVQSYYAKSLLFEFGIKNNVQFLSDYINEDYLINSENITCSNKRENVILYNPMKGLDVLSPIIRSLNNYKWIPLINLTNEQLSKLFLTSKLYIDFGPHPGKDRLPREACFLGCCIITNKKGSAMYEEDVCIPEKYKIDNPSNSIDYIDTLIESIFSDFEKNSNMYSEYRDKIKFEKKLFLKELKELFYAE